MQLVQKITDCLYEWRRKLATAGVSVLAVWIAFHVVFGTNGWMAYRQKQQEFKRLQVDVQRIQQENQGLQTQIKALRSDPAAIEKEAREQLHYAKPGEVIYVMPTTNRPATPPTATAQNR